jgi:TPR repeat protein
MVPLHVFIYALVALAAPQALAEMTAEEVKAFEVNKAKADRGDGVAVALVVEAYRSGKVVPADKTEALAMCLSTRSSTGNRFLYQDEGYRKTFSGMSDDMIARAISRSFELKVTISKFSESAQKYEPEEISPWDQYGDLDQQLSNIERSISAKRLVSDYRERVSHTPSASLMYSLAYAIADSEPYFSAKHKDVTLESKKLRRVALEMTIAKSSEASLQEIIRMASVYLRGEDGFPADKAEANKWIDLAIAKAGEGASEYDLREMIEMYQWRSPALPVDKGEAIKWRIKWIEFMLKQAATGGVYDWMQLAEFLEDNPTFLGQAGGAGFGGSVWSERYLTFQSLKAERGDSAAIDALLRYYGGHGFRGGRKSPEEIEQDGREYFRWLTLAFKKSKRPNDAISLAKLYDEGLTYDMDLYGEDRIPSRSRYVEDLVRFYFSEVMKRAALGSCDDKLILALVKDKVAEDQLNSFIGYNSGRSLEPYAFRLMTKFDFNQLGSPEFGYNSLGNPFGGPADPVYIANAALSEKMTSMSARSLYLDYLKAFDAQDFAKPGFLFMTSEDVQPNGDVLESYYPPHFESFTAKKAVLSRLAVMDDEAASIYAAAKGSPKDETLALKWRLELAKLADSPSLADMAERYDLGKGVPVDRLRSYAFAILSHGRYPNPPPSSPPASPFGTRTTATPKSIDNHYKLSADDKDKATKIVQEFITEFHERMMHIAQAAHDGFEAEQWRLRKLRAESNRKAADAGDTNAQVRLGYAYAEGAGVAKNQVEAVKWYRRSSDQGNADAQRALGYCYRDGEGVAKDQAEAFAYFKLAGLTDNESRRELAALERKISPEVLSHGQQRSGELQKEIEAKMAHQKAGK